MYCLLIVYKIPATLVNSFISFSSCLWILQGFYLHMDKHCLQIQLLLVPLQFEMLWISLLPDFPV